MKMTKKSASIFFLPLESEKNLSPKKFAESLSKYRNDALSSLESLFSQNFLCFDVFTEFELTKNLVFKVSGQR